MCFQGPELGKELSQGKRQERTVPLHSIRGTQDASGLMQLLEGTDQLDMLEDPRWYASYIFSPTWTVLGSFLASILSMFGVVVPIFAPHDSSTL